MTGIKDFNFPAFMDAEVVVRAKYPDAEIVNPARLDEGADKSWEWYLRRDVRLVLDCTHLVMLPGWRSSRGARLEHHVASELSLEILELEGGEIFPLVETAIGEATRLVYGDRGGNYGHPYKDYSKTAALWSVILGNKVSAEQAILCMVAVKISREMHIPKRDNRVDMAGYAECLNRVNELSDDERADIIKELGL
jgi:hypothetical protein